MLLGVSHGASGPIMAQLPQLAKWTRTSLCNMAKLGDRMVRAIFATFLVFRLSTVTLSRVNVSDGGLRRLRRTIFCSVPHAREEPFWCPRLVQTYVEYCMQVCAVDYLRLTAA